MMDQAIRNFPQQFAYEPKVDGGKLKKYQRFAICGMGGSALAGGLLQAWQPKLEIKIHKSYGLPHVPTEDQQQTLYIFSSYSGTTEEVLDGFEKALALKVPMAVICVGGTLLKLAQEHRLPYVQMPDTGIQPRSALGYSIKGLMRLMDLELGLAEANQLVHLLNMDAAEQAGKALAERAKDHVLSIYTSDRNQYLAYNWKIKMNETGKVPAYYNVLPEMNHNEMNGFDRTETSKHLSEHNYFVIIKSSDDDPRILKRMDALERQYKKRDLPVEVMELTGETKLHQMFTSLLIADWTAWYTAQMYDLEAEQVPMIQEFKKLIST